MATLFNKSFEYVQVSGGHYTAGKYVKGDVTRRNVRGTLQPQTSKQCLVSSDGTRTTGYINVYSSERLSFRELGGNVSGYVVFNGGTYELLTEQSYTNGLIPHYEYSACLCKDSEIPSEVSNV